MAVYRRGKIWWYNFQFQGRHIQESSGFTNKTAALRVEAKRKADLLDRRAGFTKAKLAPKFEEFAEQFLAWSKQQHRPQTRKLHGYNCQTLRRFFGGKYLDEITTEMVEDFKVARSGEAKANAEDGGIISPATVNRALTTLKKLFSHAERCGYAIPNPTRRLQFLNEGPGRMRVVSFEEEIKYLAGANPLLKDIARIMLDTGLRPEEVFRIRVENLDFTARTIFNPFGKTKAARRKVTMTEDVYELLKRRADSSSGQFVFHRKGDPDRPITRVAEAHAAAITNAAIVDGFRLYDLRHTFATRAVMAGVDLPTLSVMLGHTKIQMTMRYVHPAEEQKKIATGKLESFRIAGIVKAMEKSHGVTTISTTVN